MHEQPFFEIITADAEQTRQLGHCLGQLLDKGLVLRLHGELGSGKTCFVQGLARGLSVPADYDITSPTYALVHEYPGRLPLFHVDLYRLAGTLDIETIGLEEILSRDAVVAVEWAQRLAADQWPADTLRCEFDFQEPDGRRIRLIGSGLESNNLIKQIATFWTPSAGPCPAR
jgi:tRNA threonylcarbamoyladenosine biosynthesis protein TsaE